MDAVTKSWAALLWLAPMLVVGRHLLAQSPTLAVTIQKVNPFKPWILPTRVQSPIIVQSHESEVRPGGIVFPLLPLRTFGNTSADP